MGIFKLYKNTFKNGIHPPENKDITQGLPIRQFPFSPILIIPMSQHIGSPAEIIVREGQEVERGQILAKHLLMSPFPFIRRYRALSERYLWYPPFREIR